MAWLPEDLTDLERISGLEWSMTAVILGLLTFRIVIAASRRAKQRKAARVALLDEKTLRLRRM